MGGTAKHMTFKQERNRLFPCFITGNAICLYIPLYFVHVHEGMLWVSDLILVYCVTRCWPEHNDWTQYTDRGISNSSLWLPAYTIIPAIASTDLLKDNDLWFH